jgi:signal transduction histidine kinase
MAAQAYMGPVGVEARSSSVSVPLPTSRNIRRNLLNEALASRLERIRIEALADFVMIVRADPSAPASGIVLASSAADWICQFLPNEPIQFDPALPNMPMSCPMLDFWSTMRPCQLSCGFSMIVPWGSRTTNGWLVISNSNKLDAIRLSHKTAKDYRQQLRRIYVDAGLRTTNKLRIDIAQATRAMVEFDLGDHEPDEQLINVLSVGRGLLKTAGCYLSMPDEDPNYFRFVGHVGVRTNSFKRLRVGAGQGLGGRVRDQSRTVRTLNYSRDFREGDDPVHETVREGFHSAMCAPLYSDGRIFALLYAANRCFTPFTESDGEVLTELAANVSTMLRRTQWERVKQSALRRRERENLARDLHDSVIRNLMEIGYASRVGRDMVDPLGAKKHFDAIEVAAESCLQSIRGQIAALTTDWDDKSAPTLSNIIELLRSTTTGRRLACSFHVAPETAQKLLPANLATNLVRIGREALRNAELHSSGSKATVELKIENGAAQLTIEDDGLGIDIDALPALLSSNKHLGLRQMRSLAEESGGRCFWTLMPRAGLRVDVVVPLA